MSHPGLNQITILNYIKFLIIEQGHKIVLRIGVRLNSQPYLSTKSFISK